MPVKIICISPYQGSHDPAEIWNEKTKLGTPQYCSVLLCIGKRIGYCKVHRQNDGRDYLLPLCPIHGVPQRESEVYDYYLAPL
jgi:hypothetical protein